MRIRLKIGGVDRTANLVEREWSIDHRSGGTMSTAKFMLHDPAVSLGITRGQEVIIENWVDATDRHFGGVLVDSTDREDSGLGLYWNCTALDWMFILERALVSGVWRGRSDAEIINGTNPAGSDNGIFLISDTDLTDFDASSLVQVGVTNTQFMRAQRRTVREVMDTLAKDSAYVWGVTPLKKIYYRPAGASALAFGLSTAPDEVNLFHYTEYERFFDFTHIVNSVQIEGGFLRQLAQSRSYKGDNATVLFPGIDRWEAQSGQVRILVDRNTGSDGSPVWTAQAVGLAGSPADETALGSTINVLWDPASRTLHWFTAPANLTAAFRVRGDILRMIVHIEPREDSITSLGRRYSLTIRDENITSEEEAIVRAAAELTKLSIEQERHTLLTTKDGIIPGRSIHLVNARRGIDKFLLVERLEMHLMGGQLFEYQVTLRGF